MVYSLDGQYLEEFEWVTPDQELNFPALMVASQVDLTGNTPAAWSYWTRAWNIVIIKSG